MDNPCVQSAKLQFWFTTVLGMIQIVFSVRIYILVYGHYRAGVRFKAYVKDMRGKKDTNERRIAETVEKDGDE